MSGLMDRVAALELRIAELEATRDAARAERDEARMDVLNSPFCDEALWQQHRAEAAEKAVEFHDVAAFHHPVRQVMFRAGLLAARESLARFVAAQDEHIATSIRANWWPRLGADPGPPRKNTWAEWYEGEWPDGKVIGPANPSIEALAHAYIFLELPVAAIDAASAQEQR